MAMPKTFDDFIREQATVKRAEPFDKQKALTDWKGHVEAFYEMAKSFLKKYIDEGMVKYSAIHTTIHEEQLGAYELDMLRLQIGNAQVDLEPIGTFLIGARGRIDMAGPRGTIMFLLVDKDASAPKISVRIHVAGQEPPKEESWKPTTEWSWKISTPPPKIRFTDLDATVFQTALMEVVNG